ncbi:MULTISPECIES: transcription repressor NadR [Thalassobacillus]|uniref:transcription repressor NadR n=1 Tax=Thalassobacillus TaxID=331971 RepID=UPI000A1C850C|nr:transcription repressor NadR [Thalassobacillus devorans]
MAKEQRKSTASERREEVLFMLKNREDPITGRELADKMEVSRQVIVGDISLLKAKGEPIVATSQGYIYMTDKADSPPIERTIAVKHTPQETEKELTILVDHGVFIKDVTVEHPVYGDLTASVLIWNRRDVQKFLENIKETEASFLSELTDGIHLHTIAADSEEALDEALEALQREGILLKS